MKMSRDGSYDLSKTDHTGRNHSVVYRNIALDR